MDARLRRAARRLAEAAPGAAADDVLSAVAPGLEDAARLGDAARREAGRILVRLQHEVERAWLAAPQPPSGEQVLGVLRAFRERRRALRLRLPPPLVPPDPLELLIEVAHDLRSPLTSILFLADTLQRGESGPLNALQRRQIGLVYGAALRLSALASDVVEMAQPGDRLVGNGAVAFSLGETIASVRDMVLPIAEEKRLAVRSVAPAHDRRTGHPAALGRVLLNLAVNALKVTQTGYVELRARAAGERVLFVVRDTGPGLSPAERRTLFEPFRRAPAGERRFSGTGLGLAISRRLVRAMGSELRCQSTAGEGTQFFFALRLPVAE